METLAPLRARYGIDEVHLTGGEPSIHPQVCEHTAALTKAGYAVKMTTNGQTELSRYRTCIGAGLKELNVSMHTLNPKTLGALMSPPRSSSWGEQAITRQLELLEAFTGELTMKINTCVGASEEEATKIAPLARASGAHWRVMKVLETSAASEAAITRLCRTLGAEPLSAALTRETSSCSILMGTEDGFRFSVKLIRPLRLQAMCNGGPVAAEGKCFEFAYGPRIEAADKQLLVRSCLYRSGAPFVLPSNQYLNHPIAGETYDQR